MPNAREYVVKSRHSWKGFSSRAGKYHDKPILFGNNIRSAEFRSRIICDGASGAVNIIQSIKNLILFGEEKRLDKPQYAEIFLSFARDFLPQSFGAISRYANDCDALFVELISLIHYDVELDKICLALCKINRSANESITLPRLKVKSLYSSLYAINHPEMKSQQI